MAFIRLLQSYLFLHWFDMELLLLYNKFCTCYIKTFINLESWYGRGLYYTRIYSKAGYKAGVSTVCKSGKHSRKLKCLASIFTARKEYNQDSESSVLEACALCMAPQKHCHCSSRKLVGSNPLSELKMRHQRRVFWFLVGFFCFLFFLTSANTCILLGQWVSNFLKAVKIFLQ